MSTAVFVKYAESDGILLFFIKSDFLRLDNKCFVCYHKLYIITEI